MSEYIIFDSNKFLRIPINTTAHAYARRFAQNQPTLAKKTQVYQNTLAVYIVREYLNWMGVATSLENSDSWHLATQICGDVADLEVVGLGRLECRLVKKPDLSCIIPPETMTNRIGYVAVLINKTYREGVILGFSPTAKTGLLQLNQLQSVEDFIEYLIEQPKKSTISSSLSQWIAGLVTQDWQPLDSLLSQSSLALRSNHLSEIETELTWGKVLNFAFQMGNQSLVLLITLKPENSSSMIIQVRLQPSENDRYLPLGVSLSLVSEQAEELQKIESRKYDNYVQMLPFRCATQETFRIKVTLNDLILEEEFVV